MGRNNFEPLHKIITDAEKLNELDEDKKKLMIRSLAKLNFDISIKSAFDALTEAYSKTLSKEMEKEVCRIQEDLLRTFILPQEH